MVALVLWIAAIYLLAINRLACVVWIDYCKKRIGRRGLLWGYRYEMEFCEIHRVLLWNQGRGGMHLTIVKDKEQIVRGKHGGYVKGKYIQLDDNEKNRAFIRAVWHGPIARL